MNVRAKSITAGQLRMIWATARKLGLDEDLLRAKAKDLCGSESLSALSASQAARLIDALTGKPTTSRYRGSNAQVGIILGLARDLGWEDPARLSGFLRSRWQVDRPEWLTSYQARDVIEAMKAMLAGGRGERKGYQAG